MTTALTCVGVGRNFGALAALADVSFEVQPGEVRAVIGPNGAGKSTLFNVIAGTLKPTGGQVLVHGQDLTGMRSQVVCQKGVSRTFQLSALFPEMSAFDNVRLAAQGKLAGRWKMFGGAHVLEEAAELAQSAMVRLNLQGIADSPAGTLSHGDQRLVEVAMALAQQPKILMLDEPTQGMSIRETQRTVETLRAMLGEENLTVILVEHDMDVVFSLADRIAVLHRGRLIADGSVEEVKADAAVQDAYLWGLD
ncbi:MAG: ABC transporter ATP-binding protein [Alcaligenaceae bacterium]